MRMSVNISPRPSPSASASPSTTNTSSPSRMPLATVLPRVSSRLSELGWFVPYYFFLFSLQKQFIRLEPPWGHCKVGGEDSPHYVYKGFQYSVEVSPSSFTYPPSFRLVIGAVPRSSSSPPAGAVTQCSPFPPTSTLNLVKPRTTSRGNVFEMPPWLLETSLPRGRTTSVAVSVTSPASETSSFNTNCVLQGDKLRGDVFRCQVAVRLRQSHGVYPGRFHVSGEISEERGHDSNLLRRIELRDTSRNPGLYCMSPFPIPQRDPLDDVSDGRSRWFDGSLDRCLRRESARDCLADHLLCPSLETQEEGIHVSVFPLSAHLLSPDKPCRTPNCRSTPSGPMPPSTSCTRLPPRSRSRTFDPSSRCTPPRVDPNNPSSLRMFLPYRWDCPLCSPDSPPGTKRRGRRVKYGE